MGEKSGIDFSGIKRIKPYYSDGKLRLILKLSLPISGLDNEAFTSRFNAFYKELERAYMAEAEKSGVLREKHPRPATLEVICSENVAPAGCLSVSRKWRLRLGNGELKFGECCDVFNLSNGLFVKEKREKNPKRKRKISKSDKTLDFVK